MNRIPRWSCVLACVCAARLCADQVSLKNGDRLTGTIVAADAKVLTLKTEFAGEVKIDRAAIASIVVNKPLNVTLKDAAPVKATLSGPMESLEMKKSDGPATAVKAEAISALRDDATQKAWEREQERLTHARLGDFWAGFVSLGIANASGNASTTTVSTAASASRAAGKNKLQLNFSQIYARQSTTQPYGETANRISGGVRLDRDVSGKVFVYGMNGYDYDKFLSLDLRVVAGGGFGYHAWRTGKGYFDVSGGGNWNREAFTTLTRTAGEATVAQELGWQPMERLKLFERLSFFPNLTETGQYRMNFDATAGVPVKKWLEFTTGFSSRYLSNPLAGKKSSDTVLTLGIRASFDQTKR